MKNKNVITSFSYPLEKVDVIELAEDRAKSEGKSLSQYIVSLMENEQKKELALTNPTNIQYDKRQFNNSVNIPLEEFMEITDAKRLVEQIPTEYLPKAFNNSKRLNQQVQFKMYGKITI